MTCSYIVFTKHSFISKFLLGISSASAVITIVHFDIAIIIKIIRFSLSQTGDIIVDFPLLYRTRFTKNTRLTFARHNSCSPECLARTVQNECAPSTKNSEITELFKKWFYIYQVIVDNGYGLNTYKSKTKLLVAGNQRMSVRVIILIIRTLIRRIAQQV